MALNSPNLRLLVEEYEVLVQEAHVRDFDSFAGRTRLMRLLTKEAAWTQQGAAELLGLVQVYGSFILRNAAALALALGIDDGEKGL